MSDSDLEQINPVKHQESEQNNSESQQSNPYADQDEEDSFIARDDEIEDSYSSRGSASDESDDGPRKKSSKKSKKNRKKLKKHRKRDSESQLDEGDLDIIEQDEEQQGRLRRLKKKTQKKKFAYSDEQELQEDEEEQDDLDPYGDDDIAGSEHSSVGGYQQMNDSDSPLDEGGMQEEGEDIFQPEDAKRNFQEQEDKEIIAWDIPERYFYQLRNYAKANNSSIEEALRIFETQDRMSEVDWIYAKAFSRMRYQGGDDRAIKDRIRNVLECLHREKIEIMYIYQYRKRLHADIFGLNDLWTIHRLDQEWFVFKEQFDKIRENLVNVIFSFQQMPKLESMLNHTVDIEKLKYFREFQSFKLPKAPTNGKRSHIYEVLTQMRQKGVDDWLTRGEIFLSPENLCYNLKEKKTEKKCKTPIGEPRLQLEKLLKNFNTENQKTRYPLLVPEKRIETICHYLELQLFSHPQLRQFLKDKYMKKLVLSTNPTKKGSQDINIYNMYFPVKKIKQSPISSLNRQLWVLALEAQRQDLISIELKFEWEASSISGESTHRNLDRDDVYKTLIKHYYDVSVHEEGERWNLFRKQVITKMLQNYFFPAFFKEVKEELAKEGEEIVIERSCQKFRDMLMQGPPRSQGTLSMVLEDKKLGIVFVDEFGEVHSPLQITLSNDEELKKFAGDEIIRKYNEDFKPELIIVGANCRRAQTLRKALRQQSEVDDSFNRGRRAFISFGQYEIPSLIARQRKLEGSTEQIPVLEAISMARYARNPLTQILTLWSNNLKENGILSINLHPYQTFINQNKLKASLEQVAVSVVNQLGIDINDLTHRENDSGRKVLQFVCGLGPRKAYDFYEKIKQGKILNREQIRDIVSGDLVFKNCSSFFKIETPYHKGLLERLDTDKKKHKQKFHDINLLDMTRIPKEWYETTEQLCLKAIKNSLVDLRQRKIYTNYPEGTLALMEIFKHPEKINNIEWMESMDRNLFFDEGFVKEQLKLRFSTNSYQKKELEGESLFFSLLKESRQTLRKYMIFTVKIISVKNQFLNVVIPENGLFGSIKIYEQKSEYQKGNYIKAVITAFPFEQYQHSRYPEQMSRFNDQNDEKELLKVEMSLNFPHKAASEEKGSEYNNSLESFKAIVKEIHPIIDLEKDRFELTKEDKPVIEVREDFIRANKPEYRKIQHKKFKNLSAGPAIDYIKSSPIGDFVFRPSSEGVEFLNITWHFFKGVIVHIRVQQQKALGASTNVYRIVSDRDSKTYQNLDEVIEKYINPMNSLVQDVISNRKFKNEPIEKIEETVKMEMSKDPNLIHYYFGCSPEYPQYFLLVYMYRDRKPIKELIKVRNSGLCFHTDVFANIRELISWFKEHLKDKKYQQFVKSFAIKK